MKSIKTSISSRLVALLAGAALFGLISQSALAAGTLSGTVISNTASLAYSVSGFAQPAVPSAPVTFTVDNKVNLTVATLSNANILPNSTNQVLYFSVTNNGNTSQSYALTTTVNGVPTATMTNFRIYNDNGGSGPGVYDGTNTLYVAGAATVAPDAVIKVLVLADQTAPTASIGQTAAYNLIAQTTNAGTAVVTTATAGANTAGVDVVFADVAGSADVIYDGKHSSFGTYTVAITLPTVVKSATLLCDPYTAVLANAKNIPGSMTLWTIVVNNPGAVPITLTSITDALTVANLTIDSNLVVPTTAGTCSSGTGVPAFGAGKGFKVVPSVARKLGGSAAGASAAVSYFTTANDADGVEFLTPNVTATFSTILPVDGAHATAGLLNAGESVTLYFNTTVN